MTLRENRKALVAVDLGAQSCRISLLRWAQTKPSIEIAHRFPTEPVQGADGLRWDIDEIFAGVCAGLRKCAALATEGIDSIAVDGWAVDYILLDECGHALANPYCYRDPRTEEAERQVHAILPPAKLYALTGVQILRINTLYQLFADKLAGADLRAPWLLLPESITYRLGGRRVAEYTNATHTGLVQLGTQHWCAEIFDRLGLELAFAPEIVPCGTIVGSLEGELAGLPAFRNTRLIAAATHDTASAIAAIPATGDDWAFISSGTWSLVGTVADSPCVSEAAREMNFTNLGGAGGKICFLKNVNGMWLLRQCIDEWKEMGHATSVAQLITACETLPAPSQLIDVDDSDLLLPGNALQKLNAQLQRAGAVPFALNSSTIAPIANLVFHSLAARYAEVLASVQKVTGKSLRRLFIVGGGSRNHFLNRLTAERTGLSVHPGSAEATTIGNFAIQLATLDADDGAAQGISAASLARYSEYLAASAFGLSSDPETN